MERHKVQALNVWFRSRQREWWQKNRLLSTGSLLLMLGAMSCYSAFRTDLEPALWLSICFTSYLVAIGPILVLLLIIKQIAYCTPRREEPFAASAKHLYRASLKNAYMMALQPFAWLWVLPWAAVIGVEIAYLGLSDELVFLIPVQQCLLMLLAIQLQIFFALCLPPFKFRSILTLMPATSLALFNAVMWLYLTGYVGSTIEETIPSLLLASIIAFAAVLALMIVRTASWPLNYMADEEPGHQINP